jgi:hypothetical protein
MFNVKKIFCMIYKKNLNKSKLKLKEKKNLKEWQKVQDKISIQHHRTTKMNEIQKNSKNKI